MARRKDTGLNLMTPSCVRMTGGTGAAEGCRMLDVHRAARRQRVPRVRVSSRWQSLNQEEATVANARGSMGCSIVLVTVLATTGSVAHAAHAARSHSATSLASVPEPLQPWVGWVLHGDAEEQLACPQLHGREDGRICAWPARLSLSVNDNGGTFSQEWEVFHAGLVKLPGSDEHWPLDVRLDGKPAAVVTDDADPGAGARPRPSPGDRSLFLGRVAARRAGRAAGDWLARAHRQRQAHRFPRAR